jgi:hypothetical protein
MHHTRSATLAAAGLALLLAACAGDNSVGPGNQLEVTNVPDSFQWQVSNLSNVTQRFTYTWQNTGVIATVNQASAITAGVVTVTIRDGSGIEVFVGNQTNTGTFDTGLGTTGSWTIEVVLSGASGTVNFRVDKKA